MHSFDSQRSLVNVCAECKLCTNFTHASPPWLQHRDFGGSVTILSHYLPPTRLNRYSAPHTMNSRSLIVPVTLSHRVTAITPLLSFSFIVKALSRSTQLNPTNFSLVRATRINSCRLLIFNQLIRLGIPIREQRKTLHVVIFSGPLSTECRSLDATVTPERGFYKQSSQPVPNRKTHSQHDTRSYRWFGSHS